VKFNPDRHAQTTTARDRARALRAETTPPERRLWSRLRAGRLAGYKFLRQHPIGPYTADSFCAEAGLVVELDETASTTRNVTMTCTRSG